MRSDLEVHLFDRFHLAETSWATLFLAMAGFRYQNTSPPRSKPDHVGPAPGEQSAHESHAARPGRSRRKPCIWTTWLYMRPIRPGRLLSIRCLR
uniref:Uncharacterized protein n=1 Tax=Mus musculus TaxID=10090 RepID=Q3TYY5_MOUSE|nr:unnamed protein product [Mus musculus]